MKQQTSRPRRPTLFAMTVVLLVGAASAAAETAGSVAGTWQGALQAGGGIELRLALHVDEAEDGTLGGTLDSVDQGALGIPIDVMSLTDGVLRFEIGRIAGSYEGTLDAAGERLEGTWKQGGISLPLTFERGGETPELVRPQEPQPPYPYTEEEVTFRHGEGDAVVTLAGTLTLPPGAGPHPAAVLVSGSGPQDRDETVFGHRPFLILADDLTRRGIAVLRYDDRGVGGSGGSSETATSEDFADDALAAVRYLTSRADVDGRRVGIVGHSEGGLIAPLVASRGDEVAFVVMIAGPGVPGDELLALQTELLLRAAGTAEEQVAAVLETQRRGFEILARERDDERARAAFEELVLQRFEELPAAAREALGEGDPKAVAETQARAMASPWMRFFLAHDPGPALREVRCPVLAVNGEKDLQVSPGQNLPAILAALLEAGNPDVTVVQLPGLNHLLQTAESGLPAEYARIEETVAPVALRTIGDWLETRLLPGG